ncbi:hypothetical protein BGZ97_011901, partial [Linnemannia gamsii]
PHHDTGNDPAAAIGNMTDHFPKGKSLSAKRTPASSSKWKKDIVDEIDEDDGSGDDDDGANDDAHDDVGSGDPTLYTAQQSAFGAGYAAIQSSFAPNRYPYNPYGYFQAPPPYFQQPTGSGHSAIYPPNGEIPQKKSKQKPLMNWEEYSLSWSAQKCTYKVLAKSRPTTKQLEDLELPELNPVQVDADRFIRILNSPTTVDYGIIQIAQKSLPIESNSKGDVAPKDADSLGNVVPELLLLQEDVASQKLMLAKKEQSLLDALRRP